ncbi:MAG: Uma2 family endonuclease, partial [Ardenticatenaceae bacterium]
ISNERMSVIKQIIDSGPDLTVEILSLGRNRANIKDKLADYAKAGVRECWILSPEASTVEVLEVKKDNNWKRLCLVGVGDKVESNVLEGFEVEVTRIFE